jgi:hypothetical protein
MHKENIVKEFIAAELNLPLAFIHNNADLYTLSILSDYFKYTDNKVVKDKTDINPENLILTPSDLPYEADKNCFRFSLLPLLLDGVEYPISNRTPYYEESFSRDGLTEYSLGVACLMITLENSIENCSIPDNEAELCNTVEDLLR